MSANSKIIGTDELLRFPRNSLTPSSATHACKALDYFLEIRLLAVENDSWVEKACITRLWITISFPDSEATIEELHEHMDMIFRGRNRPLDPTPTHAAQSVRLSRQAAQ